MRNDRDDHFQWQPTSRSARWYEWIFILLLLGFAAGVRAAPIYKCIGAAGEVAYQGLPCAQGQNASLMQIAAPPAYAPSPQYAVADRHTQTRQPTRAARHEAHEPTSYLCRSADGQVFYRHGACPHSVASIGTNPSGHDPARSAHAKHGSTSTASTGVSSERIDRDEACRQIHRAGAIGRSGHEHDETVSTYDHNLGRDPCR